MKLLVRRSAVYGILRWSQRALLAGAVLALGYCAFVALDSWKFQQNEQRELEQALSAGRGAGDAAIKPLPSALADTRTPVADSLIGRIEVRRLGISVMVIEGTTENTLRHAAGHISGTAMPGVPGNVGIAAHRDTFFRPLRNVRKNDIITLTTANAEYRYRVVSTRIVEPEDVSVLDPSPDEVLTLVTCYPFYFVGSAPDRFIVRAERIA